MVGKEALAIGSGELCMWMGGSPSQGLSLDSLGNAQQKKYTCGDDFTIPTLILQTTTNDLHFVGGNKIGHLEKEARRRLQVTKLCGASGVQK